MTDRMTWKKNTLLKIIVWDDVFERSEEFMYLELTVCNINMSLQRHLLWNKAEKTAANRVHFALAKLLCSRILSRASKLIIYKTLISPILWIPERSSHKLYWNSECFRIKVLCKIIDPVYKRRIRRKGRTMKSMKIHL